MVKIITLHNVNKKQFDWLYSFLRKLDKIFGVADPSNTNLLNQSNKILLTFDDGFKSNKIVADKILKKLNIKAIFFISYDFIDLIPSEAYEFAQKNFYPTRKITESDGNMTSMTWGDIHSLIQDKHIIGGHTFSHPNLKLLNSYQDKHHEIVNSSKFIEDKINNPINHFAYPFGNLSSIDKESVEIAKNHFMYAFSNIRGSTRLSPSRHFLFRQNIVPGISLIKSFLIFSGLLNYKYRNIRKKAIDKLFS